jgi:hypothetical protein
MWLVISLWLWLGMLFLYQVLLLRRQKSQRLAAKEVLSAATLGFHLELLVLHLPPHLA